MIEATIHINNQVDMLHVYIAEKITVLGIGNNPMVGCTVACAVDVAQALNK